MSTAPSSLVKRAFEKKKKDFKGFSMRWLAGQLNVTHAYLSQILSGKRKIPISLVEPLCRILDLDVEAKARVYKEVFKGKGFTPLEPKRSKSKMRTEALAAWTLVPNHDFDLISDANNVAILLATLLDGYDGTASYIAGRLMLPKAMVVATMEILEKRGYVTMQDGVLKVSQAYFEFQSQSGKEYLRSYHKSIMQKAKETLETKKLQSDLDRRLITSSTMTCSRENVERLKMKIADFLKEFAEESAAGASDDIYHLGISFFPVSKAD